MWADTLMSAERGHLVRLLWWGLASVIVGGTVLVGLRARAPRPALVWHFAIQTAAWGAIDVALVAMGWQGLRLRDVDGYRALREFLWLNVGLDAGYVGVGVTLAICGWVMGKRVGLVGAGTAVVVQGLALLVLDGWLVVVLNRLTVA
jgi:hypothetical protein